MMFKRSGVSVLLSTDGANNLFVFLYMLHVLAFAVTVYLLYMLFKVVFFLERDRALSADPRFDNFRYLSFLLNWCNIIIVFLFVLCLLDILYLII